MSIAPYRDGVITARELGPELWLDGDTASDDGLVLLRVKLGANMYLDRTGALCAIDRTQPLTRYEWFLLAMTWLVALIAGVFLGWTHERISDLAWFAVTLVFAVALVFAFIAGWVFRVTSSRP